MTGEHAAARLRAAAAVLAESALVVVYWSLRSGHHRALTFAAILLVVKVPFCAGLLQRRPGALLALLMLELAAIVFALAAGPVLLRVADIVLAGLAFGLLVSASTEFPRVELPGT